MMSYDGCQQQGCWIVRFLHATKLPCPSFFIHQRVYSDYLADDETTIERSTGLVVGLVYKEPGLSRRLYLPGWYCLVQWDDTKITRSRSTYVEIHEIELAAEVEQDE